MVTGAALLVGLYGRFKGLGMAPLGVDEFYMSRSVDNLLRTGLPEFLCGGYYNRGIAYQYIVGLIRLLGMPAELAGRSVSAVASLAVLPAVYLLGRRIHGRTVGLIACCLLLLSVWEIEMGRFARMYAPFQAVFAWYLVFLLSYLENRNRKALLAMIAASLLGVLTWEGGALLGIINLLPPFLRHRDGRLQRSDWLYLGAMALLFILLYVMAITDLRTLSAVPAYAAPLALKPRGHPALWQETTREFLTNPVWPLLAVVPTGLAVLSLRWIWSLRVRWLAAVGLGAAVVAAIAHQFLLVVAVLLLLMLAGMVGWRELLSREARYYLPTLLACMLFWLCFGLGTHAWIAASAISSPSHAVHALGHQLFGFPNIIDNIARPWGRTVPRLSVILLISVAALTVTSVVRQQTRGAAAALLTVTLVMLLAVGTASGDRFETRYLFFLYPLLLVLAIAALGTLVRRVFNNAAIAASALCAGALLCFAVTEDFQPMHIARVDSSSISFRVGMKPALIDHYYPHNDTRSAAHWLTQHAGPTDLVVSGIPSLDSYYDRTDFAFLDEQDERYEAYACAAGTRDRWSNKPLLSSTDQFGSQVQSGRRVFLVMYPSLAQRVMSQAEARRWDYRMAWSSIDGGVRVLVFNPR
jgi:hypothetical protein